MLVAQYKLVEKRVSIAFVSKEMFLAKTQFVFFALLLVAVSGDVGADKGKIDIVPEAKLAPSPYYRWAHEHWIWNHNSKSDQADAQQLMDDYEKHDIKYGGVNIDSEWATAFNNFTPDTDKFPDFQGLVSEIHKKGKRVILWATSFVNTDSPDYDMAVEKKYLVRNNRGEVRPLKWWHGEGGLIDYSNPEAREWWHGMMDRVLKLPNGDGVDGWKCDASDPYFIEYLAGGGALGYNDVPYEGYHQYADYYYGDFFNYTREVRGDAGLIMSRPVDCEERLTGRICMAQSPKYVMASGWVGDDNADMSGLRGCAKKVIWSAWEGYSNYGCDIGGYRDQQLSPEDTKEYFLRSAQLNAFLPLMENGGAGEHRPWEVNGGDDEITSTYRNLVFEHTRLSPYLLTIGSYALEQEVNVVKPLATKEGSEKFERPRSHRYYPEPTTYAYTLGDDIFVHPVLTAVLERENVTAGTSIEDIRFPGDQSTTWLDWFHPSVDKFSHEGGSSHLRPVPVTEIPVYVRKGAMLPLLQDIPLGGKMDVFTFTWFAPTFSDVVTTSEMREPKEEGPGMTAEGKWLSEKTVQVSISAREGPVALSIPGVEKPANVDTSKSALCFAHVYNPVRKTLDVLCQNNKRGVIITVDF